VSVVRRELGSGPVVVDGMGDGHAVVVVVEGKGSGGGVINRRPGWRGIGASCCFLELADARRVAGQMMSCGVRVKWISAPVHRNY